MWLLGYLIFLHLGLRVMDIYAEETTVSVMFLFPCQYGQI